MEINYTKKFRKSYRYRIKNNKNLSRKFNDRLQVFVQDPDNPLLKDHKLTGTKKNLRAFSITGDIRVLYLRKGDIIDFMDIGTHNQVY